MVFIVSFYVGCLYYETVKLASYYQYKQKIRKFRIFFTSNALTVLISIEEQ